MTDMTTPERGLFERIIGACCINQASGDVGRLREITDDFEQRLAEAEAKIVDYRQTMVAAAEEINEHWQAHCDAEGYGPQNLVRRLESGIQAQYDGYSIGMFRAKMDEIAQLRARCGELEGLLKTKNSALKTFGRHYESCRSTFQINSKWGACSCGFDAAYDAAPQPAQEQKGCDYQGRHFGASYEDATCIDGYLWDLDSCDEPGGALRSGGDIPCPQCNGAEYKSYYDDEQEQTTK